MLDWNDAHQARQVLFKCYQQIPFVSTIFLLFGVNYMSLVIPCRFTFSSFVCFSFSLLLHFIHLYSFYYAHIFSVYYSPHITNHQSRSFIINLLYPLYLPRLLNSLICNFRSAFAVHLISLSSLFVGSLLLFFFLFPQLAL